jgi:rhodanese-related sulfurtransferase
MNGRIQITAFLLILGSFLAFIPQKKPDRFAVKSNELAQWAVADTFILSVDEVATLINREVRDVTLIDVRSEEDFRTCNLPGSVHIPLEKIADPVHRDILNRRTGKNIFYSNGDEKSAAALTFAAGLGYKNNFRMKGGLNEWFSVVMHSAFTGERLTAGENALFGNRYDARKLFTEYNSLPDSLKSKLFVSRQVEKAKLDGGCE